MFTVPHEGSFELRLDSDTTFFARDMPRPDIGTATWLIIRESEESLRIAIKVMQRQPGGVQFRFGHELGDKEIDSPGHSQGRQPGISR
jgi:hypothetical protein